MIATNNIIINIENKNKSAKCKKIKKKARDLLEVSTSHGIPNIVRTKNIFILIMWIICTLTSTCTCSFFVIDSVLNYLKYHTVINNQIINEPQAQFPAISICAKPSFNSTYYLNQTFSFSIFNNVFQNNVSQYFEEYNDNILNKCFRYNSGNSIQNSTISGYKFGLKLGIKLDIPDGYDFTEVVVFIHNQSLPPIDALSSNGYFLMPGSLNFFELDRVFYKKLAAPYSNCLKNVNSFQLNKTLIDFLHRVNKRAYTQNDCLYHCSRLFVLEKSQCGCNSSLNDFSKNCIRLSYMLETETQKCVSEYLRNFRKKDHYEKCSQYCPLECDSMNYLINKYTEQLPISGSVSKKTQIDYYLADFNSYEEIKKHYLEIFIYYNDLKYTLISEEPKTETFNFASNIGGILGLFLGISFLSFIEIFEFLFEIIFILFKK